MAPSSLRSVVLQLIVAIAAIAMPAAHAAAARSVAESATAKADAAYQRLVDAANAVVAVKVKALANARSNETLGAERVGSGVLIRQDLVVTIGYLVLEADTVEVTDAAPRGARFVITLPARRLPSDTTQVLEVPPWPAS